MRSRNVTGAHTGPLEPLEIASGLVVGSEPTAPLSAPGVEPRRALELALRRALEDAPCLVTFSGGRDSSALLALAAAVAREEGLPLPVPFTRRFAGAPHAEESTWQELVIEHLGLPDWQVIEIPAGGSDWVGPAGTRALRRHGLLYPPNAFGHVPAFEAASDGSVVTGVGGDDVFATWRWQLVGDLLGRRRGPEPRDALRLLNAAAPGPVRALAMRSRAPELEWLRLPARRAAARRWLKYQAAEPARWDARMHWMARSRHLALMSSSLAALAHAAGATVRIPLLDHAFLAALARAGGARGLGDRTALMRHLFGDLLPEAVLSRRSKAVFHEVYWAEPSRRLAADWDGQGVDSDLVDVDALRSEWAKPHPHALTAILLQSVWLASAAGE
jgi:asparagine synthase (glutamine-hydrolysing)